MKQKDISISNDFLERVPRSLVKAITFRGVIMVSDSLIIGAITHSYSVTFWVVIASNVASTVLYFLHERVWNTISWGKTMLNQKRG